MKNAIIKIVIGTIIVGFTGFTLNMIFGNAIGFIEIHRENGILIYTYNFWDYLENLRNSFTGTTALTLDLPTRQWIVHIDANFWEGEFWSQLGNNLAVILDYMIFAINIILWPLRLGAYTVRCVIALIGINVIPPINHNLAWLVNLVNGLIEFIQIPYV